MIESGIRPVQERSQQEQGGEVEAYGSGAIDPQIACKGVCGTRPEEIDANGNDEQKQEQEQLEGRT